MCGIAIAQGEVQRARKQHTCTWCYEKIEKGEHYYWNTGIYDGGFSTTKLHDECDQAVRDFLHESYEDCFMPGEGLRGKPYTIHDLPLEEEDDGMRQAYV